MTARRVAGWLSLTGLLLLASCSGGGDSSSGSSTSSTPSSASFTITVDRPTTSIPAGANFSLLVHVNRNPEFKEPVSVTVSETIPDFESDTLVLPGAVDHGILPIAISPGIAIGDSLIQLVAQGGGKSTTAQTQLTIAPPEPSSREKIETAVAAGTLDYGTSLLYRAYALYEDRRLPEQYRGMGAVVEDNGLLKEIQNALATFPTGLQSALQPFIVRPADPRSVWNTPPGQSGSPVARLAAATEPASTASCPPQSSAERSWLSKRSGSHPVRVWVQCVGDQAIDIEGEHLADKALSILDKIYGPMTALMGEPILDEEGGDNAIDFYFVDPDQYVYRREENNFAGWSPYATNVLPKIGNGVSSCVIIPRFWAYTSRFHTTIIHEFFHVLQFAHNSAFYDHPRPLVSGIKDYHWFPEASATWAAAYFDRVLAPWENGRAAYSDAHILFKPWFQPQQVALNAGSPEIHRYAAYIWPYFLEQETGGPAFMQQIWDRLRNVTTFEQADDAIDSVYPFAQNFKRFAVRNLNTEFLPGDPLPKEKRYVNLDPDQFPDRKEPPYLMGVLVADKESTQELDLPNLSARYVRLVADSSSNIRKVQFDFSQLQPAGSMDVQALVKTTLGWVSEPLDLGSGSVTFCFDKGPTTTTVRGSFEEIVLVVANHAKRLGNDVSGSLIVRPKATPCSPFPIYVGTTTFFGQMIGGFAFIRQGSAQVTWEPYPDQPGPAVYYRVRTGSVHLEIPGGDANGHCKYSFPEPTKAMSPPGGDTVASLIVDFSTNPPSYLGYGSTKIKLQLTCGTSTSPPFDGIAEWFNMGALSRGANTASLDGSLNGRVSYPDTIGGGTGEEIVYTHSFNRVEE